MKKICYMLLVAAMVVGMTGCGNSGVVTNTDSESNEAESSAGNDVYPDENGNADGFMGDVMHTYFFDYTVNSAYTCNEYNGYTPSEGNQLLVADVTVKNTHISSIEMYDTDFQVQWGGTGEDDYDWPITAYDTANKVADEQLADVYELGINESTEGVLVYEVPEGTKDFSISYLEYFDDSTTGDVYFVYFTAAQQ